MRQSIDSRSIREGFIVEFYAYNVTALNIVKKIYVRVPFGTKNNNDKKIILNEGELNLISHALNSRFLSSFHSNRYSLYDISFRQLESASNIGFSFNDVKDSVYMEPSRIFKPFMDFSIDSFINTINTIQKSMFQQQPQYNPVSMIGMVIDGMDLICIKAYIRYDLSEAPTPIERGYIVQSIIKAINSKNSSIEYFFEVAQKLEKIGFVFAFVGVDCYFNAPEHFKMYFRFCGTDMSIIAKEIALILSRVVLYTSIEKIFKQHKNGIWGLALSTNSFEDVNGVQLYFYP